MFNICLLGLLQVDLDEAGSVQLDADSLSYDLSRECQILKDSIMYSSQSTATKEDWGVLRKN